MFYRIQPVYVDRLTINLKMVSSIILSGKTVTFWMDDYREGICYEEKYGTPDKAREAYERHLFCLGAFGEPE